MNISKFELSEFQYSLLKNGSRRSGTSVGFFQEVELIQASQLVNEGLLVTTPSTVWKQHRLFFTTIKGCYVLGKHKPKWLILTLIKKFYERG